MKTCLLAVAVASPTGKIIENSLKAFERGEIFYKIWYITLFTLCSVLGKLQS